MLLNLPTNTDSLRYVPLKELSGVTPQKTFSLLGLEFHSIKDCLCVGVDGIGQSILPIRNGMSGAILEESFRHPHNDDVRHFAYFSGLKEEKPKSLTKRCRFTRSGVLTSDIGSWKASVLSFCLNGTGIRENTSSTALITSLK